MQGGGGGRTKGMRRGNERGKVEVIVRVAPDQPADGRTEGASVRIHTHTHCTNTHTHCTTLTYMIPTNTHTAVSEGESSM